MAISRVNTTSQSNTNITASVNIPSVTAGNTIVLLIADGEFNSGAAPSISDNAGNTYTLQSAAFYSTLGNPNRRNARIWTVFNANGGATNLFIIWPSSCSSRITVVEYSGVKLTSPLERTREGNNFAFGGGGGVNGPVIIGAIRWDVANSLLIGTNANNSTNTASINAVQSPSPSWNLIATNASSIGGAVCDKIPTYANPVPPNTEETQGLIGNGSGQQCFATLVILKADLTLSFNETLTPGDTQANNVSKPLSDATSLSDFLDLILSALNKFKDLFDTLVLADVAIMTAAYQRVLQDNEPLIDTIIFMHQAFRSISDHINLQDWISVKKTNSDHWGS